MPKILLKPENDYDFDLIGISCHQKDYRLGFELNKMLEIDLQRDKDLVINKKGTTSNYSLSLYEDEENHRDYFLISNGGSGGRLIPEQKNSDFFLMVRGVISNDELVETVDLIKGIDIVLAAFNIEISTLKSKEFLLF